MMVEARMTGQGCHCDTTELGRDLIGIDAALAHIARHATAVKGTETIAADKALGRVLARDLRARGMTPPFDNSAMDGYALNVDDLTGPAPWKLRISDRVQAGQSASGGLVAGSAARILTGAPMPPGADTVVMQEVVKAEGDMIVLNDMPEQGSNVRRAGEDMSEGEVVISAGQRLGAREIAVCAAAGHDRVDVRRRIRVAILTTGDEVKPAGQTLDRAQIWDVNTPMLRAALSGAPVDLVACRAVADTRDALRQAIRQLAGKADLLVTSGAISVGEEDHVRPALNDLGAQIFFSGVAIKPGKPVSFGRLGGALWLGLPGNPLSAFVTWHLFGRAVVDGMSGFAGRGRSRRYVVADTEIRHSPGRCELRPARLLGYDGFGREIAVCDAATHSARIAGLPDTDGLLFIPADVEALYKGDLIEFLPFCES